MPRTFLVRRTALQLHTATSEEDVKAVQVESVIQNTDSTVQECKPSYKERLADICTQKIEQPLIKTNKSENLEAVNKSAVDQSPTYLSRAVSNAIRVDSVTGVIENKTLLLDCHVKEEPVDIELDAEVAYHTDKSFSSQQTFSRPTSFSSVNRSDSQTFQTSTYSDISEPVFQDLERTRSTSLSLPVIAPHQPLPPFASLVYNVFAAARKPMGETLQDTFDVEPSNIIKLPLKLPTRVEDGHEKYSTETVTDNSLNNVNKHTLIKTEEKVTKDARLENECGKNEEKDKTQIKSAHKIWNPFHHVSTPKTKVLPISSVSSNHVPDMSSPQFSHQFVNSVTPAINNSYISSTNLVSPQLTISDLRSPETIMSPYNVTHGARSPYFSESNRSFQTISQINAAQNFHPGFSPTIPSPFLPYPTYYTPDPYIRSHTVAHSRTSTPVASTASSTPVIQTERPIFTGKKRPCTPVTETPKRMRINNLPFQIYQESASPSFVENSIHKLPYTCPVTPVLSRKSGHDQENIPLNSNRTHIQLRTPIHSRSPAILGPSSISKENIPHSKLDETPVLKIYKDKPTPQKIEVINGGYGIKNPSFVPPKPADITNIQHDQTGKGSFICKVCGKDFAIQRLLNRHLKCHSETKRYLCTFCGKGFNDTFDLKRHTRIHTGVKPYKCNNCEKAFTQRCSLESHCRKVHNMEMNFGYKQRRNKTYVCEDCGHSTTDPEVHFNHLKERHPNCPTLAKPHDKRHFKFQSERSSSGPLRPRN